MFWGPVSGPFFSPLRGQLSSPLYHHPYRSSLNFKFGGFTALLAYGRQTLPIPWSLYKFIFTVSVFSVSESMDSGCVLGRAGSEHPRHKGQWSWAPRSVSRAFYGIKGPQLLQQLCVSPSNIRPSIWEKCHHCLYPPVPFESPLFASDTPTALLNIFLVQRTTSLGENLFSFAFSL